MLRGVSLSKHFKSFEALSEDTQPFCILPAKKLKEDIRYVCLLLIFCRVPFGLVSWGKPREGSTAVPHYRVGFLLLFRLPDSLIHPSHSATQDEHGMNGCNKKKKIVAKVADHDIHFDPSHLINRFYWDTGDFNTAQQVKLCCKLLPCTLHIP